MSGYLQRLIARSTTTRSTIRPQAQPPQAGFSLMDQTGRSELNTAPDYSNREPQRAQNASDGVSASHLSAATADINTAWLANTENTEFVLTTPPLELARPINADTHSPSSEFSEPKPAHPPQAQHTVPLTSTQFAITQPKVALAQSRVKLAEDLLVTDAPDAFRLMEAASAMPTANILPQANITPGRTLGPQQLNPIRHPLPPLGNQRESEATEVHVHIGRIEVTAVQGETQIKRTPVARRKPQSLDDYLAKRSKP